MPFNDSELAGAMGVKLIQAGVLTAAQLRALLQNGRTEVEVSSTLTPDQILAFPRYWLLLNRWLTERGGTVAGITANNVPGRTPGVDPTSRQKRILYDDGGNCKTLRQTERTIMQAHFVSAFS